MSALGSRRVPGEAVRPSRRSFALVLGALPLLVTRAALAGSYLDRAALLVSEAVAQDRFLEKRLRDLELAKMCRELAAARLRAAREALVPKEVVLAHPHLLLLLEHYERACSSAASKEFARYYRLRRSAQEEEQLFRSVLEQLGWKLPPQAGAPR